MKITKGQQGYIKHKKSSEMIKTVIYFAIPLALFFAGLIAAGTRKNLLTIVAVLGILPASKNAVLLIMYLKSSGIDTETFDSVQTALSKIEKSLKSDLISLYDMVFTTAEKTYEVPSMVLYGGSAFGYLRVSKEKKGRELARDLEKHLETTLKKEGLSVNVKIYEDAGEFCNRISDIKEVSRAKDIPGEKIKKVLCDISL